MRRSTRRLLKLALTALAVVLCTSLLLRSLSGGNQVLDYVSGGPFLPKAPREHNPQQEALHGLAQKSPSAGGSGGSNDVEASDGKKDWHDRALMSREAEAKGAGEQGAAFFLPAGLDKKKDELYKVNGFNALASDFIALNRSLPDIRHPGCQKKRYSAKLPTASVVVPFHNEHWTTLLRTATSVLNRSPPGLIKEIILADDFSNKEQLKKPLEDYIAKHWTNVRVVRATRREGLIRARLLGAKQATGDVLIFLDSHTEANANWLPPLLDPIAKDYRTVVCPFIDVIDFETFAYRAQDEGARGSFDWELYYKRLPLLPEDLANPTEPFKSPVMAGGLFAISRRYFWELGGYDEGLDVWGGEQYELSFKIWQCGGMIYWVPCSRVGHVYRGFMPYSFGELAKKRKGPLITVNYKRVVEVWMDEYKEYFYTREPLATYYDPGDLSSQLEMRKRLQCKSFSWFMKNVAYDVLKNFPLLPRNLYWGEIRHDASGQCIDAMGAHPPSTAALSSCHGTGGNQIFRLNAEGQLGLGERCMDASSKSMEVVYCALGTVDGPWEYSVDTKSLYHKKHQQCLTYGKRGNKVHLAKCDDSDTNQHWTFHEIQGS